MQLPSAQRSLSDCFRGSAAGSQPARRHRRTERLSREGQTLPPGAAAAGVSSSVSTCCKGGSRWIQRPIARIARQLCGAQPRRPHRADRVAPGQRQELSIAQARACGCIRAALARRPDPAESQQGCRTPFELRRASRGIKLEVLCQRSVSSRAWKSEAVRRSPPSFSSYLQQGCGDAGLTLLAAVGQPPGSSTPVGFGCRETAASTGPVVHIQRQSPGCGRDSRLASSRHQFASSTVAHDLQPGAAGRGRDGTPATDLLLQLQGLVWLRSTICILEVWLQQSGTAGPARSLPCRQINRSRFAERPVLSPVPSRAVGTRRRARAERRALQAGGLAPPSRARRARQGDNRITEFAAPVSGSGCH